MLFAAPEGFELSNPFLDQTDFKSVPFADTVETPNELLVKLPFLSSSVGSDACSRIQLHMSSCQFLVDGTGLPPVSVAVGTLKHN